MITPDMLEGLALWGILSESLGLQNSGKLTELDRHRVIRRLIGILVTDMVEATNARLRESAVKSALELQKLDHNVIGFSEAMYPRNRELKDFLYTNLYRHPRVVRMQVKAERILSDLFTAYQKDAAMLPKHVQGWIDKRGPERTICDYIAGMTDRYAIEEYKKLFDPAVKP
jgi:dGTPase